MGKVLIVYSTGLRALLDYLAVEISSSTDRHLRGIRFVAARALFVLGVPLPDLGAKPSPGHLDRRGIEKTTRTLHLSGEGQLEGVAGRSTRHQNQKWMNGIGMSTEKNRISACRAPSTVAAGVVALVMSSGMRKCAQSIADVSKINTTPRAIVLLRASSART
jgi:hypothetical protein